MELPRNLGGLVRLAKGPGGLTLATSLAGQAFVMVTGIIAARALGVDGRGTLALLWLVPMVLALIGGIGVAPATTYYVARNPKYMRAIIGISLRIILLLSVGLSVFYALILLVFNPGNHDFSTLDGAFSVALLPCILLQNLAIASLLGQERFRAYNAARLIPVAAYATFSMIVVLAGATNLTGIMAACLSAWTLALVPSWILVHKTPADCDGEPDATRRDIMGFGLRGVVGSVSPIDDVRLDQFLVGLLLDSHALGLYVSAISFCNIQRFIALGVGAVSYPRVAAERRGLVAWALTIRYFRIGLLLIAGASFGLFLLLPVLIPLFFGQGFSEAVGLGRILLGGTFLLAVHRLLTELARGLGHPGYASISEAVNAIVFLAVVFLALNPITAHGIAWSVVAGGISCVLLLGWLLLRLRGPLRAGHANEATQDLSDQEFAVESAGLSGE